MAREFKVHFANGLIVEVEGLAEGETYSYQDNVMVELGILSEQRWREFLADTPLDEQVVLVMLVTDSKVVGFKPDDAKIETVEASEDDPRYHQRAQFLLSELALEREIDENAHHAGGTTIYTGVKPS